MFDPLLLLNYRISVIASLGTQCKKMWSLQRIFVFLLNRQQEQQIIVQIWKEKSIGEASKRRSVRFMPEVL